MSDLTKKLAEKTRARQLTILALGILTLLAVLPVLAGCCYTYMAEDDFSFESGALDVIEIYGSSLKGSLIRGYVYFMNHQGTYIANFLYHFIRPYTRGGLPAVHALLIFHVVLLVAAYYLFFAKLTEDRLKATALTLLAAVVTFWLGDRSNMELFFWYTGAMTYTLMLAFALISCAYTIECLRCVSDSGALTGSQATVSRYRRSLVLASVFAVLGSGGTLEVASPHCAFLVIALAMNAKRLKKRSIVGLPFLLAFLGALVNALAPGNFVRAGGDAMPGHATALDAVRDTWGCYWSESGKILGSPIFWLMAALLFLAGVLLRIRVRRDGMPLSWLITLIPGLFLLRFLTAFPVIYGYHYWNLKAYRTTATYELVARLTYLFFVLCLAQFLTEHLPEPKAKLLRPAAYVLLALSLGVCLISFPRTRETLQDGFAYRISSDLRHGTMQQVYAVRTYVLSSMELAPEGSDVFLRIDANVESRSVYGMGLNDDPGWFVNQSAAHLYDLNSVTVIYE